MKNSFATNLKFLRKVAQFTQRQLAETRSNIKKILYLENGKTEPNLDTLISRAIFFDESTDFLLGIEQ